jgi:hypothetical protein
LHRRKLIAASAFVSVGVVVAALTWWLWRD